MGFDQGQCVIDSDGGNVGGCVGSIEDVDSGREFGGSGGVGVGRAFAYSWNVAVGGRCSGCGGGGGEVEEDAEVMVMAVSEVVVGADDILVVIVVTLKELKFTDYYNLLIFRKIFFINILSIYLLLFWI